MVFQLDRTPKLHSNKLLTLLVHCIILLTCSREIQQLSLKWECIYTNVVITLNFSIFLQLKCYMVTVFLWLCPFTESVDSLALGSWPLSTWSRSSPVTGWTWSFNSWTCEWLFSKVLPKKPYHYCIMI